MTHVKLLNPNVARPSFASITDYDLRKNREVTDTNKDLNVSINCEAEITYNNDQIGVHEKIDRDISSVNNLMKISHIYVWSS